MPNTKPSVIEKDTVAIGKMAGRADGVNQKRLARQGSTINNQKE